MRLLLKSAVGFIDLAVADHRPSLIPSPRTAHSRKFPLLSDSPRQVVVDALVTSGHAHRRFPRRSSEDGFQEVQ
ncbi:hypothetical protein SCLCIDRAFT_1208390 [Scleroderma citrinum Foug A]|uniref:Uncharacterized protein n=1 Tax=Scleroderma citrinum Foug A TaxID=1036808 RepID=A0A0C3A5L5_9AGAM|nr:hypothetical protein SCLCIDRAFT_1208390 [Scleroderma citrinum Foug A]